MNEEKAREDFETWIPANYLGKSLEREYFFFKLGIASAIIKSVEKCESMKLCQDNLTPDDYVEAIKNIYN